MGNKSNPYTTHHLLCKSKNGTNHRYNKKRLRQTTHRALHCLFGNMTPSEQVKHILELNSPCIQGDFKRDIEKILDLYKGLEYHPGVKR